MEEAKDKDKKLLCDPQKLLHTVRNADFFVHKLFWTIEKFETLYKNFDRFLPDFVPILVRYLVQFREFFISIWQFT